MRYSDAIARAAAIGHQRAIAQGSNWLRTEPYENVTIGHGEDKSPYRSFVVVTANPGDPHNEVSAVGSLNSEGVPVLRRVEEYSGDARNAYGNLSHPLVGANAFFVYEGGRGALRVLTGMAEQNDVNIVGTSHGESGDRRYAFAALTLEGGDSDLNTLYSDVRNLRYLDTAPKGVSKRLNVHHAFVIS